LGRKKAIKREETILYIKFHVDRALPISREKSERKFWWKKKKERKKERKKKKNRASTVTIVCTAYAELRCICRQVSVVEILVHM